MEPGVIADKLRCIGPFRIDRVVEPLRLSIGLGSIRAGADMTDPPGKGPHRGALFCRKGGPRGIRGVSGEASQARPGEPWGFLCLDDSSK